MLNIINSLSAEGLSINDERVVKVLGDCIETKMALTGEDDAGEQYEHLARWLIYLANILELEQTSIVDIFLDATLHSMITMRRELLFGYSCHAYKSWDHGWSGINASNRFLIRQYIEKKTQWSDAIAVVSRS